MMYYSKKLEHIEYFKLHYYDDALRSAYKYFSTISVDESDVQSYIDYFRSCEKFGLSFYLYYVDLYKDTREIIGFSNFEIKEMPESHMIDLTVFDEEEIDEYFYKIFREDGYFIVSDNSLRMNTFEDTIFSELKVELSNNRKLHLLMFE